MGLRRSIYGTTLYLSTHKRIGEFVSKNVDQDLARLIVEPPSGLDVSLSIRLCQTMFLSEEASEMFYS